MRTVAEDAHGRGRRATGAPRGPSPPPPMLPARGAAAPLRAAVRPRRGRTAAAAAVFAAALCLPAVASARTAADPDALWEIVHGECVPNLRRSGDPAPCAAVDLQGGAERGYALLKDRSGAPRNTF
jgi:CDP-diacylglycerol pyrophosphatase